MHNIVERLDTLPAFILGSGSRSRRAVLTEIGLTFQVARPQVNERDLDDQFIELGPVRYARMLAALKAESVAEQYPDSLVLGADQVGVIDGDTPILLTQQPTVDSAVDQLMVMSGTTHRLINALFVVHQASGITVSGEQSIAVTMRKFSRAEAREYVERFEPFESAGSYRIEDQERMDPLDPFLVSVVENDESGVRGLPLSVLATMISMFAEQWQQK